MPKITLDEQSKQDLENFAKGFMHDCLARWMANRGMFVDVVQKDFNVEVPNEIDFQWRKDDEGQSISEGISF